MRISVANCASSGSEAGGREEEGGGAGIPGISESTILSLAQMQKRASPAKEARASQKSECYSDFLTPFSAAFSFFATFAFLVSIDLVTQLPAMSTCCLYSSAVSSKSAR